MAKKLMLVTGDKRLNRKLRKLTTGQQKKAFRKAARPAMKPMQGTVKKRVEQEFDGTGDLRKSVKIRSLPRSRSRVGVRVSTSIGHAPAQEFGWKAGKARRQIKGRGFMKQSAEKKRRAVMDDYLQRLNREIVSAAKKG